MGRHQRGGREGPTEGTANMNNKVTIQNINTRITKSRSQTVHVKNKCARDKVLSLLWDLAIQETKVTVAEGSLSDCEVEHTELILEVM